MRITDKIIKNNERLQIVSSLTLLLIMLPAISWAGPWGALAVDQNKEFIYGWSHDYSSDSAAKKRALAECKKRGGECSIVLVYTGPGCGAYRTTPANQGNAYGWGVHKEKSQALSLAMANCQKRAGAKATCTNHVWSCNEKTEDAFRVAYISDDTGTQDNLAETIDQIDTLLLATATNVRYELNTNEGLTKYRESSRIKYAGDGKVSISKKSNYNKSAAPPVKFRKPIDIRKADANAVRVATLRINTNKKSKEYSASTTGREIFYVFGFFGQWNSVKVYDEKNANRLAELTKKAINIAKSQ
ncbi:MAG: DUF4189 domain-containing protein [Gammaproteobacteria bacterium]|nr:DUF4189 domain-containing protein [Gammaproteobacteria bacterium]